MPDSPLILFAAPTPVDKARRYGGPPSSHYPSHQRQVERLTPKFNALEQALNKGRVKIAQNPDGVPIEYTLVLEVADNPEGFETAVKNLKADTDDLEWLFEVVDCNVPNTDDFYRATKNGVRDNKKMMTFKFFCIMTNQRVLSEILSLWKNFKQDENCIFPYGQTGLRTVFETLNDIHLWGEAERLEETGILDIWREQLSDPDKTDVKCEIELFFRQSSVRRTQIQSQLTQYIEGIGGRVIAASCIEAIGYHAILASIPRQYAEQIIQKEAVELVQFDSIMFLKPSGQSIVLGTDDGLPFEKSFHVPSDLIDEPIVALFDGLLQERHPLLDGFLLIDDPDDFTSVYQITDRQHGTSMASLIARGVSIRAVYDAVKGKPVSQEAAKAVSKALGRTLDRTFNTEENSRTLSPKTVIEHHRLISTVLDQASKEGLVPFNVASKATLPKQQRKEVNYFQPEEITAIRDALESEPVKWRTMTHLLLVGGMRRGELLGLKWDKVDFDGNRIHICNNILYAVDRGIYEDTPKTATSDRWITLPTETMKMLRQYRAWQSGERLRLGGYYQDQGFVFAQDSGKPMHPDSVNDWLGKFSKRHGLPHINPHAFRHSMASLLYFNGVDSVSISKRLGHAQVSTTANIYAHVMEEADKKNADILADVLLKNG